MDFNLKKFGNVFRLFRVHLVVFLGIAVFFEILGNWFLLIMLVTFQSLGFFASG